MNFSRLIPAFIPLAALLAASGIAASCTKAVIEEKTPLSLTIKTSEATPFASQSFVSVTSSGDWTLDFEEPASWASLSVNSGSGNKADIILKWNSNQENSARSCTLVLSDGDEEVKAVLTQAAVKEDLKELVPDPVPGWMEISSIPGDMTFITHPMTIDGVKYRNYSFCWDTGSLVARWVAYPLNKTLLKGGCGRTDMWGLDPKVPKDKQPVLYKGFAVYGVRGHQIPSADRQIREYNIETFYGTNMTPQNSQLNSGVWSQLEEKVRSRSRSVDTLYVVTGCTVERSSLKALDNEGKQVTVPSGYFKALLSYSKSTTAPSATGGYSGIAFYFDNASFSGSLMNASMTIDALEEKTGLDFFVNLPSAIGAAKADKVESTIDSLWN